MRAEAAGDSKTRKRLWVTGALAALALAVAACSGAPTHTPTPTPTATPTRIPADVTVAASDVTISFPDVVTFNLNANSPVPLRRVELEFWTDSVYSCSSSSYSSVRLEMEPSTDVALSWDLEMKKTGSLAPGTTISWRWRMGDEQGRTFVSNTQEASYDDERFRWQTYQRDNVTYYWYEGGSLFGQQVADAIAGGLATLELGRDLVKPIKAMIYPDSDAMRGAILFAPAWSGGLAFEAQNVLLITVDPDWLEEDAAGVVHELAHLLVEEVVFNCIGHMPTWLSEGLAMYAEGPLSENDQLALDDAVNSDSLVTIRSLSSSFPAAHTGATLSYAQSQSLVAYLIDTYGWGMMRELLDVFGEGTAFDDAFERVYRMDMAAIGAEWQAGLG